MHELSKAAQELLSAAAGDPPLNDDQTQAIWSRVEQRVQWPEGTTAEQRGLVSSGVFSATRAEPEPTSPQTTQQRPTLLQRRRWWRTLWLSLGPWGSLGVGAAAAAVGAAVLVSTPTSPVPAPPAEPSMNVREVETGLPEHRAPSNAETPPTPSPTAPLAESSGTQRERNPRAAPVVSAGEPAAPLRAEVASLDRVYRKLDAGKYEQALNELDRHNSAYPEGALGLEARAAGWIARCKLSPEPATRDAAAPFLSRLGKTPLAQRVHRACAQPSPKAQPSTEAP